jgi:hypothetical protein
MSIRRLALVLDNQSHQGNSCRTCDCYDPRTVIDHPQRQEVRPMMNITELLITGYDGAAILFATTLTPEEAKVVKPGSSAEGETVVGEAWQEATDAFAAICDLMNRVVGAPTAASL